METMLEVDPVEAEYARKSWRGNFKDSAEFDILLIYFKNGLTFREISRRIGRPENFVRNSYYRYFKPVFGLSERDRLRKVSMLKKLEKLDWEYQQAEHPILYRIAQEAMSYGAVASPISMTKAGELTGEIVRDLLKIDGRTCHIHYSTHAFDPKKGTGAKYLHTRLNRETLEGTDFSIFHYGEPNAERFFIFPNTILEERFLFRKDRSEIYIPLQIQHTRPARLDFPFYENAWYLIRQK